MYVVHENGVARFVFKPAQSAEKAELAGSFSGWMPVAMKRRRGGGFAVTVQLPRGAHEYKFVVDGQWYADPDNQLRLPNPFGTENSLAVVP